MTDLDALIAKYEEPVAPKCIACDRPMITVLRDFTFWWQCPTATDPNAGEKHLNRYRVTLAETKPDPAVAAALRKLKAMEEAFEDVCNSEVTPTFLAWKHYATIEKFAGKYRGRLWKDGEIIMTDPYDLAWLAYEAARKIAEGEDG